MFLNSLIFFLFLCIKNSQNFVQAELQPKHTPTSDEFLECDYSGFESQIEILKTSNDFLKLRFETIQFQLNKQGEILKGLEKKLDIIPKSLQRLETKILAKNQENFVKISDLLSEKNQLAQARSQEPPVDDKWQMMSDIKEIVKGHDNVLETLSQKLKSVEKVLTQASWETHTRQLGNSIAKNLTALENISKTLTNIETITATKTDQIAFNRNIQKYFNKNEATKICHKTEDQKLFCTTQSYPTDCADFNEHFCANNKCRIYNHLYGPNTFLVSCDDHTESGGWTVIQRRINGSVDFYRGWSEYKDGFGNIDGEFFIGLDKLHALTTTLQPVELLIQLQDFNNISKYAKYDAFIVGNETEYYKLQKVGTYSGNAGDALKLHQGYNFTTKDRDNDASVIANCAQLKTGAWWYEKCFWCNLNGKYFDKPILDENEFGISWYGFHDYSYSMKAVQMMIRPRKV